MEFYGLNNREGAILIWALAFSIWVSKSNEVRASFKTILKTLFSKPLIYGLVAMLAVIALVVWLLSLAYYWDLTLIKPAIVWLIGTAIVMFFNANESWEKKNYFKTVVAQNIGLVLGLGILGFVTDTYVFSLWAELILVPALFLISGSIAIAGTKKEFYLTKKLMESLLIFLIVLMALGGISGVINDWNNFATISNLKEYLLQPILTIMILPFFYLLALYALYENVFLRIDSALEPKLARYAKWNTFKLCNFSRVKIMSFSKEFAGKFFISSTKQDVDNLLEQFKHHLDTLPTTRHF